MPSLAEISKSIDARIAEARSEIASLEAARAALQSSGKRARGTTSASRGRSQSGRRTRATSTRTDGAGTSAGETVSVATAPTAASTDTSGTGGTKKHRRPRARRKATSAQPAPAVLLAGKLEAMLRDADDGLSVAAIVKSASARDSQVRGLLTELESAGQVRRTGVGRGTRWELVTDEQRIAQRAAELERLRASDAIAASQG